MNGSGHADSTTRAAVEAGTITVRDGANQQQDVTTLSRDTAHAANGLSPIFDKEKEQRRLEASQLIAEIGTQVGDIARTEGKIAGEKAKKDPAQLAKAREELAAEAAAKGEIFSGDSDAVEKRAYQNAQQKWGTGSAVQQGIQAVTAAVQGLAGGNINAAIAGGAAPYLAEVIHKQTTNADGTVNKTANLMAHAVLGAVVSLAQNNSALAGAAGGAAGEATGMIAESLYGRKPSELTEEEKQLVSTLGTLAAGLAGGVAGGDTSSAAAGAGAGRNAVENNHLSQQQQQSRSEELTACGGDASCKANVREKYAKEFDKVQEQINNCSNADQCVALAKEMKQWKADNTARLDELSSKARNEGVDSLTPAEVQEWANLRGAQSNFDGSINTLIYRAQTLGGSEETTTELTNIFGHAAIANAAGAAGGISKAGKGDSEQRSMLGQNGVQTASKTIWKGSGKERIDVENPNPGQRPGQIHYQDNKGNKYLYDPDTKTFPGAPNSVNNLLKDSSFKKAIDKGMSQYLGEKK